VVGTKYSPELEKADDYFKKKLDLQKADDYYFEETSEFYFSGEIHSQQNNYHQIFRKPNIFFFALE